MNDELKYDHFENTEELLEHIAIWYRDDDVYFSRWFGLNDLNNLRIYINQLQSNWNSLREWLEVNDRYSQGYFKQVLEYMNELEGKDKE